MKDNPDFEIGNRFEHAGCHYRVLAGNRCVGDKVIEFSLDGGRTWWRPPIAHGMIMFEFKCGVEENNYPPPKFQGDRKLKVAYANAVARGWRLMSVEIDGERRRKEYDAAADVEGSFNEAYRAIRERKANGGPGWEPK